MKQKKAVGIIGGMGPLATCDLYEKIIRNTKAATDQEHLRIYIDNHSEVPNRTDSILYGGENPVSYIVESGKKLASIGAEILVMACNTSHYYIEEIQKELPVPVLSIVESTFLAVKSQGIRKVALFATEGTVKAKVYQKIFEPEIEMIVPNEEEQQIVTDIIYKGVKAGDRFYDAGAYQKLVQIMESRGAEKIILGCTELPLAVEQYQISGEFVDPSLELARRLIIEAGAEVINI